jgi:hypothetical protein
VALRRIGGRHCSRCCRGCCCQNAGSIADSLCCIVSGLCFLLQPAAIAVRLAEPASNVTEVSLS